MSTSKIKTDNPIKKIMDATLTKKTAALYVRNWKYIEAFFDPKVLTQAVRKFKVRDFATFEYVQADNHYQYKHYIETGYPLITPKPVSSYVTEYSEHNGGGWERRVSKLCYEFIIPDNYQLKEKDLLIEALLLEFPYSTSLGYSRHFSVNLMSPPVSDYIFTKQLFSVYSFPDRINRSGTLPQQEIVSTAK